MREQKRHCNSGCGAFFVFGRGMVRAGCGAVGLRRSCKKPSPLKKRLLRQGSCMKWFHSPISPSSVAGAPPSPPGGRLPSAVRICSVLLPNLTKKTALSLTTRDCRSSLPLRGGRWREATDEGGRTVLTFSAMPHLSALSNASAQPKKAFPRVGKVARQCRLRAKQASVAHNASHQHQPSIPIPRPCPPPCHPERSGTTRQKSRAPTNHCRTVEPRPKRGASRRDLAC